MIATESRLEDPYHSRQDTQLVDRCRAGDEGAWADLIDKYKNLIYSVPIKYGFSRENANEIFQGVCLTLLEELNSLREPRALAAWLITTTARSCIRFKKNQGRSEPFNDGMLDLVAAAGVLPDHAVREFEQEHILRDAIGSLSPACNRLVTLLFFTEPPITYDEAASRLGLAKGSIGATRMRCLEKLRHHLEKRGLR